MDRKLASVQVIEALNPIPNADSIEVATVLGWQCVVKKEEFKVGDKIIFVEVDSVLPERPEFEFMRDRHFRVKTIKLRGQISQGLVFPLSICYQSKPEFFVVEDDVSSLLGITKWLSPSERAEMEEPKEKTKPSTTMGKILWFFGIKKKKKRRGGFPSWIPHTDETRLQAAPQMLTMLEAKHLYVTEKLDGQSATYWYKPGGLFKKEEFGICSRTQRRQEGDGSNWSRVAIENSIKKKLKAAYKENKIWYTIQGEIIGPGIQDNKYNVKNLYFSVFNIMNCEKGTYLSYEKIKEFCLKFDFVFVPVITEIVGMPLPMATVDWFVNFSKGDSRLGGTPREGIVVRTTDQKVSFKVINPEFLLKHGE